MAAKKLIVVLRGFDAGFGGGLMVVWRWFGGKFASWREPLGGGGGLTPSEKVQNL